MMRNKIVTRILLIFIISFTCSQTSRSAGHGLGLDVNLGYPVGLGISYEIGWERVDFTVLKIQVLNFWNEDIFMQCMAGIKIGNKTYVGVRAGYWHYVSYPYGDFFSFRYGGFCLEPELGRNFYGLNVAITYNYLAYDVDIDKGIFRGSIRAYPALKLGYTFWF